MLCFDSKETTDDFITESTYLRKKELLGKIQSLEQNERGHILHILKKNNVSFTKNTNGYFFNLTNISDNTLSIVERCVDLILTHRNEIQELDKKRDQEIQKYKNMIQETIQKNNQIQTKFDIDEIKIQDESSVSIQNKNILKVTSRKRMLGDIDILMKKHNKLNNKIFPKDSVFFKLSQKLNKRKRTSDEETPVTDNDSFDVIELSGEYDLDMEAEGELDDDEAGSLGEVDPEHEIEVCVDGEGDGEGDLADPDEEEDDPKSKSLTKVMKKLKITEDMEIDEVEAEGAEGEDIELHSEVDEVDGDANENTTEDNSEDTTFIQKYKFFKDLLSQQGFKCSEDKLKLDYEEYLDISQFT